MASWLKGVSLALVTAGVVGGGYALWSAKTGDAAKFRPAFNEFMGQGTIALNTLIETASRKEARRVELAQAKLPFIVIEPRDFVAPTIRLPQSYGPLPAPAPRQQQSTGPAPMAMDLRLTTSEGAPAMDLNPVEARLRARIPTEVVGYFDLFLYVSKATPDRGDWGQRMFVLAKEKERQNTFRLIHLWKVSTGREEPMPSPSGKMLGTDTPQGMFKLDKHRFHEDYRSRQWDSPMPFAMFFDWQIDGRPSGLAIHGTDEQGEAELGTRASHGCIRLSTENARALFELVRDNYRGRVPMFQINPDTRTMSTTGALVRDENGRVVMTSGYKVLVFIEDYGGPSVDSVAALY